LTRSTVKLAYSAMIALVALERLCRHYVDKLYT
jgi:hypothetical protein